MSNEYLKNLTGKTIYLIPTGNAARYKPKRITKALLLKVSRVNVTIQTESGVPQSMRYNGKRLSGVDTNSGYIVFESESAVSDYFEVKDVAYRISQEFRYSSDFEKVGLEKLKVIQSLLFDDGEVVCND